MNKILLQAHKGVELDYPENTMASFKAALEQGYDIIELDPRETRDGKFVVLHNEIINKTARNKDGSELAEPVSILDLNYEDTFAYDFGIWRGEQFKGEHLPLFSEALRFSVQHDIPLKIDRKIWKLPDVGRFLDEVNKSGAHVAISCKTAENVEEALLHVPNAEISFDAPIGFDYIESVSERIGRERTEMWFAIDKSMATWAPETMFATKETVEKARPFAKIGIWAVEDVESYRQAVSLYQPEMCETVGTIKPEQLEK